MREGLSDLLSFEMFILNSTETNQSSFTILNSFITNFLKIISSNTIPCNDLLVFAKSFLNSQMSGQSLGFGHSRNYQASSNIKVEEVSLDTFFSEASLSKLLRKKESQVQKEFIEMFSLWMDSLNFENISTLPLNFIISLFGGHLKTSWN